MEQTLEFDGELEAAFDLELGKHESSEAERLWRRFASLR
jgi:hypothetical protein